jgi:hypothetical protein
MPDEPEIAPEEIIAAADALIDIWERRTFHGQLAFPGYNWLAR